MARQLVIRSTADLRLASQHHCGDDIGTECCFEKMAVELVQRASELQLTEREQAAGFIRKAAMAGSSFRKLQDAMLIVKRKD